MAEGLSLREFGRQIDVTGEAVRKAIKTGRIPAECIGYTDKGWPTIVDPARAAEAFGRDRNPNQVRDKEVLAEGAKRGWAQRRGEAPPPPPADDDAGAAAGAVGSLRAGSGLPSITESKTITEAYKARLAKLEYEEKAGRLVNADQVKIGFVKLVAAAKTKILGVPSKAKARIPTLTVTDIEILEDLLAEALEELANGER